ncbi:TonB-dependent receptor [Aliikangiella marina]|uniref:TonB-dependent receptor n=1 Tax=Aliikangiella marina TaxID=1712262 RepID=A0A545T8Z9_9GAMM|nr:TonB-dependent receptor [Aliikangiella marina]TQV73691.1 TonB-dependent receptor [Aliikangiella marina]
MKTIELRKLIKSMRNTLLVSASLSLAAPVVVIAQEAEEDEAQKIVVTGSRIKRADIEGANPVTVIEREALELSTANNLGEFLQTLPSSSGSPIGTKTNNGGSGAVTVDLRGMGAARTLTLVNGRRVVDGGDLQTIPLTMVERVEVLKDGASAVYGADAVAGVVNIITRRDFSGSEATVEISRYQDVDGGGQRIRTGLINGADYEKGNITWGLEWDRQDEIFQGDTKYDMYNYPLFVFDPTLYTSYRLPSVNDPAVVEFGSTRNFQGVFDLASGGGPITLIDGASGTSPSDFRPANLSLAPGNDLWNYAPVNYIQTPFERVSFFASADYEVNSYANLYMDFRYNDRGSETLLAPSPYDTSSNPGYTLANGAQGISADNYYNPFGEDVVRVRRRMLETGGRRFNTDVNQYQATLGLEGNIGDTSWAYDISLTSGQRSRIDTDFGQFSGARLQSALGPSFMDAEGNIVCGTPGNVIAGCVPLNLFGGGGTVTQDMLDYISVTLNDRFDTELDIWNATFTGDVIELPAGTLSASIGIENRTDWTRFIPDSAKSLGAVTGGTAAARQGSYKTDTIFMEAVVPILSDVAGAKSLELDIGARSDDNTIFGEQTTVQFGIRWQPTDGLLIRATTSDVFRAPTISSLFAGQSQGATPTVSDPCRASNWSTLTPTQQSNCIGQGVPDGGWNQQDTQFTQTSGGNPNLQAEEGTTKTFGIAWSPDFVDGLNLTLDHWEIELDGGIQSISAQNALNLCANFNQLCDNITRDVTGVLGNPGAVTNVNAFLQNVAFEKAEGIDLEANYQFETSIGSFNTRLIYSHMIERTQVPFEGGTPLNLEGTYNSGLDASFPEDKFKLSADWRLDQFSASLSMDYISKLTVPLTFFANTYETENVYYFDAHTSYTLPEGDTKFTFAIANLLDQDPIYIESGFNTNSDEGTFRTLGRQFLLRVSHTF